MVEIQEVTEDPTPSVTSEDADDKNDDAKDTDGGHEDKKDEDGWTKLMGEDLMMKVCVCACVCFSMDRFRLVFPE